MFPFSLFVSLERGGVGVRGEGEDGGGGGLIGTSGFHIFFWILSGSFRKVEVVCYDRLGSFWLFAVNQTRTVEFNGENGAVIVFWVR